MMFRRFFQPRKQAASLNVVYPDDVMLVGYPKSGNTWLRFLIGNYLTSGMCDFTNSHEIVPGLEDSAIYCERINRPRFIHSHFTCDKLVGAHRDFRKKLPSIVLIVRDGRDVAVSYYFHLKKQKIIRADADFDEYLKRLNRGEFYPFQSWGEFNSRWIDWLAGSENSWLLLRYEDMLQNPQLELRRLLAFSGYPPDDLRLELAIANSSFEKMRILEQQQEAKHSSLSKSDPSIRFVREGRAGQWGDHFNDETLSEFERINRDAHIRLGYE